MTDMLDRPVLDDALERPVVTRRPMRAPDAPFQPLSATVRYPLGPVPDVQDAAPPEAPAREPRIWRGRPLWEVRGQGLWETHGQRLWDGLRGAVARRPWIRSRVTAGLLGVFFGGLGLHRLYLGYWRRGLTMLAITVIGGFFTLGLAAVVMGVCGFVEGLLYLSVRRGRFSRDARGRALRG